LIFLQHPKKKQRVRVVEFWIETARECFNIGNFNSLMAIIAGLNMSPVARLKKTVRNKAFLNNIKLLYVYLIRFAPNQLYLMSDWPR